MRVFLIIFPPVLAIIVVIVVCIYTNLKDNKLHMKNETSKRNEHSIYLSHPTSFKEINILNDLVLHVSRLEISQFNKNKIENVIKFEIELLEYELIKNLGKDAYNKLKEE